MHSKNQNKMISKKIKRNPAITEFIQNHQKWLMTTRFNQETWEENCRFREKYPKIGCIYPSQEPISENVPADNILFVLEMNNDTNRIVGIGMMKNHSIRNTAKYRVYSNQNYNRYTYLGKQRIDRTDMTEQEETIMKVFDILCFKGSKHMKRLRGIKAFPAYMLFRCKEELDLVAFIVEMFKSRMQPNAVGDKKEKT
jgi:hypothetical protein